VISFAPAFIGGLGTTALLVGGFVFVVILGGILGYFLLFVQGSGDPWDEFADATRAIVEDENADAIAFIPYSDGPLVPKPAIYDKELLGGKGGYRTPDGDRIYVDGQGNGKFSLQGVDVILSIDPTQHAAAADPLKAHIAHLKDLGQWIKVDREGNLIEAGDAVKSLDDETPAMDVPKNEGVAADGGGYASEVHRKALEDDMALEDAKAALEEANLLHKIVDLASPREAVVDEETGEVEVEEATHVAVDVSKAADLLPKKTNTTAWQVLEEKARQEGRDEDRLMEYFMYGALTGGAIGGAIGVIMAVIFVFA